MTTTTRIAVLVLAAAGSSFGGTSFDGLSVSPVGDATLDTSSGNLVVSNIGSSGKDGVSIDLPSYLDLKVDLVEPALPPGGAPSLTMRAWGTLDGQPDQLVHEGRVGDMDGDGMSEIAVGSPGIQGVFEHTGHVFLDGSFVGSFLVRTFDFMEVSGMPDSIGVGPSFKAADDPAPCQPPLADMYYCYGTPGHPCGIDWYFPSGSLILCCNNHPDGAGIVHQCGIPGGIILAFPEAVEIAFAPAGGQPGGSLVGDRVVFEPVMDPARIGHLTRADLLGQEISSVTVTGFRSDGVEHLACPGDTNNDGLTDFDDLNVVLSNWNTAGPAGDVNGSGFVDFDDLNLVLSNWGRVCLEP